jgi:hypothetical protein
MCGLSGEGRRRGCGGRGCRLVFEGIGLELWEGVLVRDLIGRWWTERTYLLIVRLLRWEPKRPCISRIGEWDGELAGGS